ncbi:response regulator [Clostridium sp. 19966]|uniref:response regulator transcription factor n=1 Tax=Clostridium sp. 19966 TaxID=2768166 RepID=UPI0028DEA1F4|nr:response regulator [Clostridium sp. 19966]MDT8716724.1 response regulator [Clostridium sp. 19966]
MKVLIVDDEKFIRKGLITTVNWNKVGIEAVEEAENGKKAIEIIQDFTPNIILSDIKMPFFDGLQLSKYVYENFPKIKIILLSGYDEFSYAQQAIRYGVMDYLLKPIKEEKLIETIQAVKGVIIEEERREKEILSIKEKLNASLSISREYYLKNLMYGSETDFENVKKEFECLNISFKPENIVVMVIKFKYKENEISIINFAKIKDEIQRIISKDFDFEYVHIFGKNAAIIIHKPENFDEVEFMKMIKEKADKLVKLLKVSLNISVCIGIGSFQNSIEKIKHSFDEAIVLTQYSQSNEGTGVASSTDITKNDIGIQKKLFKLEEDVELWMRTGNIEPVYQMLDNIAEQVRPAVKEELECYKRLCIELIIKMNKVMDEFHIDNGIFITDELYAQLLDMRNLMDIREYMLVELKRYEELLNKFKKDNSNKKLIQKSIQYMKEHYKEDLAVISVAKEVGLSPNYFSHLFKQEIGKSFVNVMNEYKIEKAKQLLAQGELKIYEVADSLGFSDYRYFTQIFKKYVGCTPKEYMNIAI